MAQFGTINQDNPKDKALSEALKILTDKFEQITEFSTKELKALSIIQTDKYLEGLITFYVANKRHVKRKYASEILKAFEMCSREKTDKGLMDKILRRERY